METVQFDSAEVLVLAGSSNGSVKLWDLEEAKGVVHAYIRLPQFGLTLIACIFFSFLAMLV